MPSIEHQSAPNNPDTSGSSIPHWAAITGTEEEKQKKTKQTAKERFLRQKVLSKSDFAQILSEPPLVKKAGLQFLKEYNLPRYKKVSVNLQEFLDSPEGTFKELVSETGLYYSSILNLESGERIFRLGQRQKEVIEFILDKLSSKEIILNSELILSEYWHNYYGGNLLISKNGRILVELVEGKHAKLVKSEGQVLMSAETQIHTNFLQFKNKPEMDEQLQTSLRQAIIRTLSLVPKRQVFLDEEVLTRFQEARFDKKGNKYVELPHDGYFEFILTKKSEEEEKLRTIFIDARVGRAADKYQLTE